MKRMRLLLLGACTLFACNNKPSDRAIVPPDRSSGNETAILPYARERTPGWAIGDLNIGWKYNMPFNHLFEA